MSYLDVLTLVGGLAMFLFGMSIMGTSLEKRAGNQLKSILAHLTSSPINGFLLGLGVTAIIQSSSATTVMVVGFVNSGIMTLGQSVYIIMGANVGTAVTSWMLSLTGISGDVWYISMLSPACFTPVIALAGIAMYLFTRRQKTKDTASIFLGFSVLMFGMEMMSGAVAPLADVPEFTRILTMFSNPLLGVLAGTVLTAVIQSSSASVGILQALSLTGSVTFSTAIPVIMGQNIGTCVTALISSVGTNRDARRASMVHLYFNVIGTVVWLSIYYAAEAIFHFAFAQSVATPLGIAVVHTLFKVLSTAMLMPFGRHLEKLARLSVPDGKKAAEDVPMLDERLFVTPTLALDRARGALIEMAETSVITLKYALETLTGFDEGLMEKVRRGEARVDLYEDKLGTYLVQLSGRNMSESDSHELTKYLHMLGDFERISDHAVNLLASTEEMQEKHVSFSEEAKQELAVIMDAVREIMRLSLEALATGDLRVASRVEPLEQVIDLLNRSIKSRHIDRLTHGECTIEMGFVLNDILGNLERVSDHCSNIAVCIIEIAHNSFDTHEYLHDVKENHAEFISQYDAYKREFALKPPRE